MDKKKLLSEIEDRIIDLHAAEDAIRGRLGSRVVIEQREIAPATPLDGSVWDTLTGPAVTEDILHPEIAPVIWEIEDLTAQRDKLYTEIYA